MTDTVVAAGPTRRGSRRLLVRTSSASVTCGFAARCPANGYGYSMVLTLNQATQEAILDRPEQAWTPTYDIGGEPRGGAWIVEVTDLIERGKRTDGSRVIVRRKRPNPFLSLGKVVWP